MFDRILIANRGEIACRVIRTARRLGIQCVAVYSDADRDALHVRLSDDAVRIGPAPAARSYLDGERILAAASSTGARAIHPGYGFLAENADFAAACAAAGVTFIGPPADAIRAMGSKSEAKTIMERAGVPVLPGYHGADQDDDRLARESARIGFPVLIKAAAGGGGKGMRVVRDADGFAEALAGCRRESLASFGDDRVLLEKYLSGPRHIEVQVFADRHGNVVHLFERDCSMQRRHQKIVEEAPAPGIGEGLRTDIGAAAVEAARAIGYEGAGTVEFLFESERFHFMEMNTRLQVEHPVTEAITGLDLVEWQLRVAAGEPLPAPDGGVPMHGHAVEARVYAEDPARDFLPSAGVLADVLFPADRPGVRVDTGVCRGDTVGVHYDPMIAKIIAHGRDREEALHRLRSALAGTCIAGPATNLEFLEALLDHADVGTGPVDTGFVERHAAVLSRRQPPDDVHLLLAVLHRHLVMESMPAPDGDPWSPWWSGDGWRLNLPAAHVHELAGADRTYAIPSRMAGDHYRVSLDDGEHELSGAMADDRSLEAVVDGRRVHGRVITDADGLTVFHNGRQHRFRIIQHTLEEEESVATGSVTAPMPGRILSLSVAEGDRVERGTTLLVLEAMKMEHSLKAPGDGTVTEVRVGVDDLVQEGAELIRIEPAG